MEREVCPYLVGGKHQRCQRQPATWAQNTQCETNTTRFATCTGSVLHGAYYCTVRHSRGSGGYQAYQAYRPSTCLQDSVVRWLQRIEGKPQINRTTSPCSMSCTTSKTWVSRTRVPDGLVAKVEAGQHIGLSNLITALHNFCLLYGCFVRGNG